MNFLQVGVLVFGFLLAVEHLKAGGFFGGDVPCLPSGFNVDAALAQGVSVGLGVSQLALLAFRRWLAPLAVPE